ncbi:MAG: GNAT family N-acetyltransferase [Acutalibacteraceae bacterium]|nr:GNAT family N-acetyltransferase [Acutalibacteraceae bacterium]
MIRKATQKDTDSILSLLLQVDMVHHNLRPDLFKGPATKYTAQELNLILNDENTPVFVYEENGEILGYIFLIIKQIKDNVLTDIKTLYIDDLCVDENRRGEKIGEKLYNFALDFAKSNLCYNLTLNVWACNKGAMKFYEKMGLCPQKIGMEKII